MTTAPEDAQALVERLLECFNTRRFDDADELFTPDFVSHPLGTTGFDAGKDAWRTLVSRFPAVRVVPQDVLVRDDTVAVRSTVEGVEQAATPEPVLIEFFRVDDGRLAENWGSTWLPQLG